MYNIENLGAEYIVARPNGTIIKTIQVIPHEEILSAALGKYTDEFKDITTYLTESITKLEGHESVTDTKVLWYATEKKDLILSEVIEYALNNEYDKIILEHLNSEV